MNTAQACDEGTRANQLTIRRDEIEAGFTGRYEARPFAAPGVDDNEHIPSASIPIVTKTFIVPFIISNGDGLLLIVQDGGCVGKVYACLLRFAAAFRSTRERPAPLALSLEVGQTRRDQPGG